MKPKSFVEKIMFVDPELHFLIKFELREKAVVGPNNAPPCLQPEAQRRK